MKTLRQRIEAIENSLEQRFQDDNEGSFCVVIVNEKGEPLTPVDENARQLVILPDNGRGDYHCS